MINRLTGWIWGAFLLFCGLSLYFALTSENFLLTSEETTWMTVVMLAVVLGLLALLLFDNPVRRFFAWYCFRAGWGPRLAFGALVLASQVVLILATHPSIGFDAGMVYRAALHPNGATVRGYFSQNTNNLPLLLAEVGAMQLFHQQSWLFLDWVTLFLVDLAAGLNLLTVALIDRKKLATVWNLQGLGLLVFPMIIVPYTDTWVLPLVSLSLLGMVGMWQKQRPVWWRLLFAVLGGIGAGAAYLLKPSAFLGAFALVLWFIITRFGKGHYLREFTLVLVACAAFAGTAVAGQRVQDHQTYIRINQELTVPAIHFLSIGMSGSRGEYSAKEALAMAELPKRSDKVAYSKKMIKKHLAEKGVAGYLAFLVRKQGYNTADGTLGWLGEGTFMHASKPAHDSRWWWQTFLYPAGENRQCFFFVAQLAWVVLWGVLCFAKRPDELGAGFQLGVLAIFAFLLLFEGGRSRYLIQALPEMLILAGLGWQSAVERVKTVLRNCGLMEEGVVNA